MTARPRVTFNRAQRLWQCKSSLGLTLFYLWEDAYTFARWASVTNHLTAPIMYGEFWDRVIRERVL